MFDNQVSVYTVSGIAISYLRKTSALPSVYSAFCFADLFFRLLDFFVDRPTPAALVPASAAPTIAPVAAPATAPVKTSRTTFFAVLMMPGELAPPDFLRPLF